MKVLVLYGGCSGERLISLRSGKAVASALENLGHTVEMYDPQTRYSIPTDNVDICFNILHGVPGEDGGVRALLDYLQIPSTGSSVAASLLAMDKSLTKEIWLKKGINTANYWLLNDKQAVETFFQEHFSNQVDSRFVMKPVNGGSSLGIELLPPLQYSTSTSLSLVQEAWERCHRYGSVMIEQMLTGPEYTVGIVGSKVFPPLQINSQSQFFDYDAKYQSSSTQYLASSLVEHKNASMMSLAKTAYDELGCSNMGRVDLMLDHNGEFSVLEVNVHPGMTQRSLLPKAAALMGYEYVELVNLVVQDALGKNIEKNN